MHRRVLTAVAVGLFLLSLLGCSTAPPQPTSAAPAAPGTQSPTAAAPPKTEPATAPDPLQALYAAAKSEGEVVFWTPADPKEIKGVLDAFKAKYPGIAVKHFEIRADDYVSRVIAEAGQGKITADIVGGAAWRSAKDLLDRNLVEPYTWTKTFKDIDPALVSDDGKVLNFYHLLHVVAYNSALVKPEDAPRSWDDLLDPKWQGRILIEQRGNLFPYLGVEWGQEKLMAYAKRLLGQKPVFVRGGTTVAQQVVAGVAPIGIGTYGHKVLQMQGDKAPIEWAKMSPLGVEGSTQMVLKGAPHPNAAKLLAGYLLTHEAQKIYVSGAQNAAIYPGSPSPLMPDIEKQKLKLVVEDLRTLEQMGGMGKEIVNLFSGK